MKRRAPKSRISLSRRMIPVILCCLLLLSAFPVSAHAETLTAQQERLATASAMLSYDHAPGELLSAIDVNKDETINIADYTLINRFVLRTNYFFPI